MALFPESIKSSGTTRQHSKPFFHKNEQLATDKALTGLAKELIAIGAAAALGSEHCLGTHIEGAKR